jgi:hypothetical protein
MSWVDWIYIAIAGATSFISYIAFRKGETNTDLSCIAKNFFLAVTVGVFWPVSWLILTLGLLEDKIKETK